MHPWRSEKALFLTALFGGALGGVLGMAVFRHKTRHASFIAGMPALLVLNICAAAAIILFAKPLPL